MIPKLRYRTAVSAAIAIIIIAGSPLSDAKKRIRVKSAAKSGSAAKDVSDERIAIVECDTVMLMPDGFSRRYSPQDIEVFGYDKPATSDKESFFVKNGTDRTLTGFTLKVEYRGKDGKQLHSRTIETECDIPAGETRRIDIKSWDVQKSYYYEKSRVSRRPAIPYSVIITPAGIRFRR